MSVPISFGAGTAFHISDDCVKQEILRDLSDRMRVRTMMREAKVFRPGAGQDTRGAYVAHLQPRGNPYVLFLTRIGYSDVSLYVDRKVRQGFVLPRIISDRVMFPAAAYSGTAITGEMVRTDSGDWVFLAEDMLAQCGIPIGKVPYRQRYERMLRLVESVRFDQASTHRVAVKRVFPLTEAGKLDLCAFANTRPYASTGVVFRSLVPGQSSWFFRNADERVMTVTPTPTPDVYNVSDSRGNCHGRLAVHGIDVSRELSRAFADSRGRPAKMACSWTGEKWAPAYTPRPSA